MANPTDQPRMRSPLERLQQAADVLLDAEHGRRKRVYYALHALVPMRAEDFPVEAREDFAKLSGFELDLALGGMHEAKITTLELCLWRLIGVTALIAYWRGSQG